MKCANGDCTSWQGEINGESVKIESNYKTASEVDETKTKSNDMLLKFIATQFHTLRNNSSRYIHVKGCPVSVAQHVNYLAAMAKIKNPNFDPRLVFQVNTSYFQMQFNRIVNRLFN